MQAVGHWLPLLGLGQVELFTTIIRLHFKLMLSAFDFLWTLWSSHQIDPTIEISPPLTNLYPTWFLYWLIFFCNIIIRFLTIPSLLSVLSYLSLSITGRLNRIFVYYYIFTIFSVILKLFLLSLKNNYFNY